MKKNGGVVFILSIFLSIFLAYSVFALECSDPSQTIVNLNQSNNGYGYWWNNSFPSWGIYGDVNLDGDLSNTGDVSLLGMYILNGKNFSLWGEAMADVNLDGVVDVADLIVLNNYFSGRIDSLPYYSLNPPRTVNPIWGDVNTDGVVNNTDCVDIGNYVTKLLTNQPAVLPQWGVAVSDVNLDGAVNASDVNTLCGHTTQNNPTQLPVYNNIPVNPIWGDVNFDGIVGGEADYREISNYYLNGIPFDSYGKAVADVNLDGRIDVADLITLRNYNYGEYNIPYFHSPDGRSVRSQDLIYGDVNADNVVNNTDCVDIGNYVTNLIINQPAVLPQWGVAVADVNLDGSVSDLDVNTLCGYTTQNNPSQLPVYNNVPVKNWNRDVKYSICYNDVFGSSYTGTNPHSCTGSNNLFYLMSKYNSLASVNPLYGDLNLDGSAGTVSDNVRMAAHLTGSNPLPQNSVEWYMADVDLDGDIDQIDQNILLNYSLYRGGNWDGEYEHFVPGLPFVTEVVGREINNFTWGDLDFNGNVDIADLISLINHVKNNVTFDDYREQAADVNLDSNVDLADVIALNNNISGIVTLPVYNNAPISASYRFGDINADCRVGIIDANCVGTVADYQVLINFMMNGINPPLWGEAMADVNLDGVVDVADLIVLNNYAFERTINSLPYYFEEVGGKVQTSYSNAVCYGDLFCEEDVTSGSSCSNGGRVVARLNSLFSSTISQASGSGSIKICCVQIGETYWADANGNPITKANAGDTVKMISKGRGGSAESAVFRVFEYDFLFSDDQIGSFNNIENRNGDAVGLWPINKSRILEVTPDLEKAINDYDNFRFKEDSWSIESGDLIVNMTEDNTPLDFELETPKCGVNLTKGSLVTIRIRANDLDDVLIGTLNISGQDVNGQAILPLYSRSLSNGVTEFQYNFIKGGSYFIVADVRSVSGREKPRRDFANIMIIDNSINGNYAASCIDSPEDASYILNTTQEILFNGSSSRALKVLSGVLTEYDSSKIYYNWTFSDGHSQEGYGRKNFTRPLLTTQGHAFNLDFNWVRLKVSVEGDLGGSSCVQDSDGADLFVKGVKNRAVSETCVSSSKVEEYWCDLTTNEAVKMEFLCPIGSTCVDGACTGSKICVDNDGGGSGGPNVKGAVIGPLVQGGLFLYGVDKCLSQTSVTEYFCDIDNTMKSTVWNCQDFGKVCLNGACVTLCTDTDFGSNPLLKGNTYNSTEIKTDVCVTGSVIKEFYCQDNQVKSASVLCPSGSCSNGACTSNDIPSCTETDFGPDVFLKGTTSTTSGSISDDVCLGNTGVLQEFYCQDGIKKSANLGCPSGKCNDGACVQG